MDFALLPPEINSGLMYAGPGSGPMLAAAAGWHALGAELESTAVGYSAVVAALTDQTWLGPSSIAMAAAATPYVGWLSATGAAAVQTAVQAYAAAAYDTAFAMTVPPPVIAANRAMLMALIATNFFGQNTPAIAATEAQYVQMWAQDAIAMYGYAAAAETASTLEAFDDPPQTTKSDGRDARRQGRDDFQRGRDGGRHGHHNSGWRHCGDPQGSPPTQIDAGSTYTAGEGGATVTVDEGTLTVGQGSVVDVPRGIVTAAADDTIVQFSDYKLVLGAGDTFVPYGNFTVTSGSVTVPQGSTVTFTSGGSLTGGVQGASGTVTEGSIAPAAAPVVTPTTTVTPTAAAPATTAPASSSTSTTSASASTSGTSSSGTMSGTTSGTTSAPAEQVPGAQSAPGAQPQTASGVAQAAPGVAPHALPGLAAPLAAPGGVVAAAGGPAPIGGPAALGDPLQWIADGQPPGDAANVALGAPPGSLPFVHTDQVVLTSGAALLGAGGGGFTAFASTKATFYRGETVVTKIQHEALVRETSLRFVKSLDRVQSAINSSSTPNYPRVLMNYCRSIPPPEASSSR